MLEQKWIVRSADVLGGTPVFADTRVPVQTRIDYLKAGQSIEEFLDDFPTVDRDHAIGALESLKPNADEPSKRHSLETNG